MRSRPLLISLVVLAMIAFAANSLLCRAALKATRIDPGSFTLIRLGAGALVLAVIAGFRRAALPAAVGALILFCAVQVSMIGYGFWAGQRLRPLQVLGLAVALAGLIALLLPGLSAPPLDSAALMVAAGIAWGVYSLRGRRFRDPTQATAGNFLRSVPFGLGLALIMVGQVNLDPLGVVYAMVSGGITSGLGYVLWYAVLPDLAAASAAAVQLSVPVIAALGGILFLGEAMTARLLLCGVGIIGGIALVVGGKQR
ncbi:MAG TPA: DMT family transporter [Dongiaceae bacterium]